MSDSANSVLSLRRYLTLSTMLGIFSSILNVDIGSTVFLFYLVMLVNLLIIWALTGRLFLPKWLAVLVILLTGSTVLGIAQGTDTLMLGVKQLAAISLSALYFANFFELEDRPVADIWIQYCKLAYYFAVLALIIWPFECVFTHEVVRLRGVMSEPAAFCLVTLPACYWYTYLRTITRSGGKEVFWMMLALGASRSSLGFLGIALGLLLLFSTRITWKTFVMPVITFGLLVVLYFISPDVRLRVDDTVTEAMAGDVSESGANSNQSAYALVSNMYVTRRVLEVHPVMGNGLGSHVYSSERYLRDLPGVNALIQLGWDPGINTHDAASLTLRLLSEMGVVGLIAFLAFVFHFRVGKAGPRKAISNAILIVFFEKLMRGGGYANPELFFFVLVYVLNYREDRLSIPGSASAQLRLSPADAH